MSSSNDLESSSAIDLAHFPAFSLGRLNVRPDLRQLVRGDDGAEEIVEPRVMQVLLALARAKGAIVTRDQLVSACWEGRVVGEDAINRALSRVRRLAEGIGEDSFRIETVNKVGYRLVETGGRPKPQARQDTLPSASAAVTRRHLVGAAALGTAVVAGGLWWTSGRGRRAPPGPGADPLMEQAENALSQSTREGQNQAIGLYRRLVAAHPDFADGWGALGNAYAVAALYRAKDESEALRARARAAARRALELDPVNGYGQVALTLARPQRGWWLDSERALAKAVAQHPDNAQLLYAVIGVLISVGRIADSLPLMDRLQQRLPTAPDVLFHHANLLWAADRIEDADRLLDQAATLYPTHFGVWFTRFYILMYSGRAGQAVALAEDRSQRPSGIRDSEVESVVRSARAIQSHDPAAIDRVMADEVARAHLGCGYAENAIQFACATGRTDTAFDLAQAYYFNRGFSVPEVRFSPEQGSYTALGDRLTVILFKPPMRSMRSDPRFDALVEELGLKKYWKESGTRPDYLA